MQDRLRLVAPAGVAHAPRVLPGEPDDAPNFLAVVNETLARNLPPAADQGLLGTWAELGLRPGATDRFAEDAWDALKPSVQQAWATHIGAAFERVRQ